MNGNGCSAEVDVEVEVVVGSAACLCAALYCVHHKSPALRIKDPNAPKQPLDQSPVGRSASSLCKKAQLPKESRISSFSFFLRQHDKHTTNPNITVLLLFSLYSKFTRCTLHSTVYSTLFDCTVCIFSSDSARQVHTCCSSVFKAMFCLGSSIEKNLRPNIASLFIQ